MNTTAELWLEAQEALNKVWFVQGVETLNQTARTLVLRLRLQPDLFVDAFLSERSDALSFALIRHDRRVFGADREGGRWHIHPYGAAEQHVPLPVDLEPKPLLKFLARVNELLYQHDLLASHAAK